MDPPLTSGTARWTVLEELTTLQTQWTAPQLAISTGLPLGTVIRALGALRASGLIELRVWLGTDSLHWITDAGRDQLRRGAQLQLDGIS